LIDNVFKTIYTILSYCTNVEKVFEINWSIAIDIR